MNKELCQLCERHTAQKACRMDLDVVSCAQSKYSAFWPRPETSVQAIEDLVNAPAMEAIISNSRRHNMVVIDDKFYDFSNRP